MKQIPLLQGKALLIEMPEGAKDPFVAKTYIDEDGHTYDTDPQWIEWSGTYPNSTIDLPPGNWRIIGMLSEVTEEDAAKLVDEPYESGIEQYTEPDDLTGWTVSEAPMGTKYSKVMYKGYRDYTKDPDRYSVREVNPFRTALESLNSAILAEGWYFENPIKIKGVPADPNGTDYEELDFLEEEYAKAQSRVLDRSRCLLLGREGA